MSGDRFTFLAAVHVLLMRGNKVLLLRRFNTGYEDGNYSVPAGHLDGDEQVIDAAIRETREEAGVELDPVFSRVAGIMHRISNDERIDFFVVAEKWAGEIHNAEPHKCDDLCWFSTDNLPENVVPYVRRAIELTGDGVWFESFGWER
ncbi:MAG: NUDIX domain-containing protein [Thermomicrobiales bacterium]|nr:NUDIX domain-containing protein [Thermomicrobiales bacterium]